MESTANVNIEQMSAIEKLLSDNSKVVINLKMKQNIKEIVALANSIEKWAKNYDYDENKANGYRSLVEISSIYIQLVANECERFGVHKVNDTSLVNLSIVMLNCLKTAVRLREEDHIEKSDSDSDASMVIVQSKVPEENEQISLFKKDDTFIRETLFLMKNIKQSMISLSSRFAYFWLDKRFGNCNKAMLLLMSLYATPMKSWYNILTDDSCRERAVQYAIDHQTFQFLTYFWSFPKQLFIDKLLISFANFNSEVGIKEIFVPRQAKWKMDSISLEVNTQRLNDFGYIESNQSKTRCCLISKNERNKCDSIVLHCRGGMSDTQESHQPYLVDWVDKMRSIPVLSVDYTSLSEGSISVALQEIMDVYIWLISNHRSVRQKLGYQPKKVVLCGHGIGGYLMMLLLFMLNDIQSLINEESIVHASKGEQKKAKTLIERLLNILRQLRSKGLFNTLIDFSQKWLKFAGSVIHRFEVSPFKKCKNSWLIDDSRQLQERISDYVNASIAPIFHRDFDSVSDIPLYLMTSEFDYTLDDNITMAKCWKGQVTLKCFKRLPHSFLRYFYLSEEAKKASNICLSYLLNSFGFEFSENEEQEMSFIELWSKPTEAKPTLMAVNNNEHGKSFLTSLTKEKILYEIVAKNLTTLIEDQKKVVSSGFRAHVDSFLQNYHPYQDIVNKLYSWAKHHPNTIKIKVIGKSIENRNIHGVQIGDGSQQKSNVLIECGIHAREWISPASCLYLINQLLTNTNILQSYTFYMVPMLNPDGYVFTWTKDRLWRKNRRRTNNRRCFGVDLNRNFGAHFGGTGASSDPCSETYRGTSAFSEPEAKAFRDYAMSLRRVVASFHMHSYGQMILFPLGYTKRKHPRFNLLNSLGKNAVTSIRQTRGTKYTYGQSSVVLYSSSGCSDDWTFTTINPQVSYTIEGRDSGRYGFILPRNQILSASSDAWTAIMSILNNLKKQKHR
ncbi:carboxypeptidase B-like protein [Leptotrombidium deliense]|uniref:Carboxypeptidase B-like protein n=1 Tax=Leptotrombidium deliense TaxID=299467 RepID=A0A443SQL5_9ACAR|nr:carboxypeptidase B-like protein [Leptotrombidium deliense]